MDPGRGDVLDKAVRGDRQQPGRVPYATRLWKSRRAAVARCSSPQVSPSPWR